MFGLPFGMIVESLVALLLALSIGYSIVLNERLKKLHADRSELKQMIADLVRATDLANRAIQELKEAATEADTTLGARMTEAESFAIELANHVTAGQAVMERIVKIIQVARSHETETVAPPAKPAAPEKTNRAAEALKALRAHRSEGRAA